ncbi:MAG: O-methyltransferase [Clostridiales bacterium]|nr:O-methyltransferase [Clostridiales bacterium]
MIVNEKIISYINSLDTGNSKLCNEIREQAILDYVPIIRQETENLLKVLLRIKNPKSILEVGTAVGYSTLVMSENVEKDCHITTIERYEKRITLAKANFIRAGKQNMITLIEGDALEVLEHLTEKYDFIFMDAAKGQYINFLPSIMKLLDIGGILVSDNVLLDGNIVESRYDIIRRNRTIHGRMLEYLDTITHMDELQTAIIPIGDGVTISTRLDINREEVYK